MTSIDRNDLLQLNLGGKPDTVFHLYWRGDSFLMDHGHTIDVGVAINKIEKAIKQLRSEYGMDDRL